MKYFELFAGSGIGGMAAEKHGFTSVGYSEVDKDAIKNYNANFEGRVNYGDITKINTENLPMFDLLIGGSPCQDICIEKRLWTNGVNEGLKGESSKLFFDYLRILNDKLPRYFVFENVRNLLSTNDGEDFKIVKESFEENYNIHWKVVDTAEHSIPQTRRRVYIVGQRKYFGEFHYNFPVIEELTLTMQDLLEDSVDDKYYLSQKMWDYVMSCGTMTYSAKPEINLSIARPLTATMHKMHRSGVDNYVTTKHKPIDRTDLRRLTPRECARLQGLPESYRIVVSDTQAYRILGNAMSFNVVDKVVEGLATPNNETQRHTKKEEQR